MGAAPEGIMKPPEASQVRGSDSGDFRCFGVLILQFWRNCCKTLFEINLLLHFHHMKPRLRVHHWHDFAELGHLDLILVVVVVVVVKALL